MSEDITFQQVVDTGLSADGLLPRTREHFAKTLAGIGAGELYVHCPDCDGHRQIYLYRVVDDPHSGGYFSCPTCSGTGEADAQEASRFIADWQEQHEEELGEPDVSIFAVEQGA